MTTAHVGSRTSVRRQAGWTVALVGSTVGLGAAMTLLFRGMRSVMAVGGACATGGPFEVATPCPSGVGAMVALSIPLGLVVGGLGLIASFRLDAPLVAPWGWPVLFFSLGYNFWDYGLDPPAGSGIVWGWIVCAVLFTLLGAVPLWFLKESDREFTWRWGRTARWWVVHVVSAVCGVGLGWWFFDVATT